jgi:cytochrome c-type biogenesis protein
MAPLVKELERRCAGDMKTIVRVDVDEPEGEEIAARYGVRFLPTFIRTDGTGEEVRRIVGEQPKESLAGMLSELRGQACPALL